MVAGKKSFRPGVTLIEVSALVLALISLALSLLGAAYLLRRPFG